MSTLLPRCLDSLVNAQNADQIEAMVVNDGSKDNSLEVARSYEVRYPGIVTVIDKPNGNYGSTINAALPVAKGKYVKILDSDDWFDSHALDLFVDALTSLDVDIAVTHFSQIGPKVTEIVRYNTMGREPYQYGKVYQLDDILPDGYIRFFLMHSITYRTQLLRDMNYRQTEGISYTDTEWACFPTYFAQSIVFFDINLYQYNLCREGQTMDPVVILKSTHQLLKIQDSLIDFYARNINQVSETRKAFLKQYMENRYRLTYKLFLLDIPRKDFDVNYFTELEKKLHSECEQYGFQPRLYPENKILHLDCIRYWRRHHKRLPLWLEKINSCVDVIVKWFYVKLLRS
ncbi:MAG: glycosyltransferase [Bacteroidales bacterium]|nr:glycosyltransferase [Bacteroidales bacterium]